MLDEVLLRKLYVEKRHSVAEIANKLSISQGSINYWLTRYAIKKRTISDAVYQKWNPGGNPFQARGIVTQKQALLFGLGIGLYWGEGTKANRHSVRLANSDPKLLSAFIIFLVRMYGVKKHSIHFGLQLFGDMNPKKELSFWVNALKVSQSQFYKKIIVSPLRGDGNYKKKSKHGVVTLYFNNKKLRDIMCSAIDTMSVEVEKM